MIVGVMVVGTMIVGVMVVGVMIVGAAAGAGTTVRWSSAPRVYAVETYTGRYAGTATLVSTDRSGGMLGYRYVFRNLPWDTILRIRVSGPGSYVGMDDLYLPRRTSGSLDLSATFNPV